MTPPPMTRILCFGCGFDADEVAMIEREIEGEEVEGSGSLRKWKEEGSESASIWPLLRFWIFLMFLGLNTNPYPNPTVPIHLSYPLHFATQVV